MISIPQTEPMADTATSGPAANCSQRHAADGGAADVAFTAGVITVAAAFCVISLVSLCHCVRHFLVGEAQKADPLDTLFYTEDEVEMTELRHFPLPHTGQVPRVRTPPSPSPSPMKFLLSPPEARLSHTRLVVSRALVAELPVTEGDPARLTRSLPSLHTLPGGREAHGGVEHHVEMALVSAMTASSNHELEALAPEPDVTEPLLTPFSPPPSPPPPIPPRDSSGRGRRRVQRKRYPKTPRHRRPLVAATSAPPGPSHSTMDTDYQSAYAPSQATDSDDQTTIKKTETAAAAARSHSVESGFLTSGKASKRAGPEPGRVEAERPPEPKRGGSELILVSRRALERLLHRPLTATELRRGGPGWLRRREQHRSGNTRPEWDINHNVREQPERERSRRRDDITHLSGLQPLESTAAVNEDSHPARSETADVLADTEDTLADTVGTLDQTVFGMTGVLEGTGSLVDTTGTLGITIETLGNTAETVESTAITLEDTSAAAAAPAKEGRRRWFPETASPEWDSSAEPRRRPLSAPVLTASPRGDSAV